MYPSVAIGNNNIPVNPPLNNPPVPPTPPAHPTSCCQRVYECFQRIRHNFDNSRLGRLVYHGINLSPLISNACTCVSSIVNGQYFNILVNLMWNANTASEAAWKRYEWAFKLIRGAKVFAITAVPFALLTAGKAAYEIVATNEKIDAMLRMIESLGWTGDCASYFVNGLFDLDLVSRNAMTVAFSFSVASAFLSTATLALNAKHLYHGNKLLETIERTGGNYVGVLQHLNLKSDYEIRRHFGVAGHKFREKILPIIQNAENNAGIVQTTVDHLKDRIKDKNFSHKLAIASAAVTCIGMLILLFTPIFPLAYGLLALAAAVAVYNFFIERRSVNKLKHELQFAGY